MVRCDERLKGKAKGSTLLPYTRLIGGLEHLKIQKRSIDERFESVMGECVIWTHRCAIDIQRNPECGSLGENVIFIIHNIIGHKRGEKKVVKSLFLFC